jgi:hypothetical protein
VTSTHLYFKRNGPLNILNHSGKSRCESHTVIFCIFATRRKSAPVPALTPLRFEPFILFLLAIITFIPDFDKIYLSVDSKDFDLENTVHMVWGNKQYDYIKHQ